MNEAGQLRFNKVFDLSDLPKGSAIECFRFDWSGEPLLLVAGPKERYVSHWAGASLSLVVLESGPGRSSFIQRFDDGWLLADGRGGSASVYSSAGAFTGKTFDFGDGIADAQTTPSGNTWVSYFDEGIYGKTIGQYGLVCFDRDGKPLFKYHAISADRGLPPIDDLYAMNVVSDSEIWLCYYSDFPIVRLQGFEDFTLWPEVAPMRSMAVSDGSMFASRAYEKGKLFRADLEKGQWRTSELVAVDPNGNEIPRPFHTCARRNKMGLLTATAAYVATV